MKGMLDDKAEGVPPVVADAGVSAPSESGESGGIMRKAGLRDVSCQPASRLTQQTTEQTSDLPQMGANLKNMSEPTTTEGAAPAAETPNDKQTGEDGPIATRYPVSNEDIRSLAHRFTYHAPKPDQPERYVALRAGGHDLAALIQRCVPESRERAIAITKIEEAIFWANAGIARNE